MCTIKRSVVRNNSRKPTLRSRLKVVILLPSVETWRLELAADDMATRAVEVSIAPVVAAVCLLIFLLAAAPSAVAAGLSLFFPAMRRRIIAGGEDPRRDHPDPVMARPELECQFVRNGDND
jgi:hypothetical protein